MNQPKQIVLENRPAQVLALLIEGKSLHKIATTLGISPNAVSAYINRCKHRMGLHRLATIEEVLEAAEWLDVRVIISTATES